jgi:transposase
MERVLDEWIAKLEVENTRLRKDNDDLRADNAQLRQAIAELKARIDQNPRNSSKPPSSEGYAKPPSRQERRASERKAGKQKGAPGHRLEPVSDPDEVTLLDPECCADCGGSLGEADVESEKTRQVFDLPPRQAYVREYRARTCRCSCGVKTKAEFPPEAIATTCYGPQVRALAVFLVCGHHLPYERASVVMSDVCGLTISPGSIATMIKEAAFGLEPFNTVVREALRNSDVVNFDETGARVAGMLFWVHSASTDQLTAYLAHRRRGRKAIEAMGIIAVTNDDGEVLWTFDGIACHDGWRAYRSYEIIHALCNAHHLRELKAVVESGKHQSWASDLIGLLVDAKSAVAKAKDEGANGLAVPLYCDILARYDTLITTGVALNPKVPGRKQSKAANLLVRLDGQRDDVLRFVTDFSAPFDNNLAERDIRMVKIQQKISGCFRTTSGAENFCKIRSYISTAKKQGQSVMDVLIQLFEGNCWMPAVDTG